MAVLAALLLAGCAGKCGARGGLPPARPPAVTGADGQKYHLLDKGAYKAFYDRWGRIARLEYDSNGDGKPDHVAHHDGRRVPHVIDVDTDFDGRPDRWERYDEAGTLVRVGSSRDGKGPDRWTAAGPDGQPARVEIDEDRDGRIERAESLAGGKVTAVEIDSDRDGRFDRWQEWSAGRLVAETLDTDQDGTADRRLRYGPRGEILGLEPVAPR